MGILDKNYKINIILGICLPSENYIPFLDDTDITIYKNIDMLKTDHQEKSDLFIKDNVFDKFINNKQIINFKRYIAIYGRPNDVDNLSYYLIGKYTQLFDSSIFKPIILSLINEVIDSKLTFDMGLDHYFNMLYTKYCTGGHIDMKKDQEIHKYSGEPNLIEIGKILSSLNPIGNGITINTEMELYNAIKSKYGSV
jgi:hypothetical protein